MSFIDDAIAQRKALKERALQISAHGEKIFADMWTRMGGYIDEARRKNPEEFHISTNGSLFDRIVESQIIPAGATEMHREKFNLTLDAREEQITAKGDGKVNFTFNLDICQDGVVCLKFKNEPIGTDDAVVKILRRFFFPDLP